MSAVGGLALVVGGAEIEAPAELFDPATETWALTSAPLVERSEHGQVVLNDGRVLIVSGLDLDGYALTSAELWDPATGSFVPTGALARPRYGAGFTVGAGGRVLVAGGADWDLWETADEGTIHDTSEVYDPSSGVFLETPAEALRYDVLVAPLPDGRVLVAGGDNTLVDASTPIVAGMTNDSASILDLERLIWEPVVGPMQAGRAFGHAVPLLDGRVLMIGGWQYGFGAVHVTEIFDVDGGFQLGGDELERDRLNSVAVRLPSGAVLAAGGCCTDASTEVFLPEASTWTIVEPMSHRRNGAAATLLSDGRVLVSGGLDGQGDVLASSETLSRLPLGAACLMAVECSSAICSEGLCCDGSCQGSCESCSAAVKGGGLDGRCEPVSAGEPDPKHVCVDALANSCGQTGRCDGSRGCALYEAGTTCAAEACTGFTGQCSGDGACVCPSPTCSIDNRFYGATDCAPYSCIGSGCGTECSSSEECAAGYGCDRERHCVPLRPTPERSDGCGIAGRARRSAPGPPALVAIALAACFLRRRAR